VIGSILGGGVFRQMGLWPDGGLIGQLIVATVGAILLLIILRLVRRAT
jgi:uncharacterized membrane protein YeaQ/YmgE (transglycosylase-associated protein family)